MKQIGTAEIIAITTPVGKLSTLSIAEFVAYVARVSNPSNQNNHMTSGRLLRYLARNQHWSPFEMMNIVMEINTTRDIARQILRHRSFSFQEFSQRYANPLEDLGMTVREPRLQDTKNRQSSVETDDQDLHDAWDLRQQIVINSATAAYNWAIQNGVAKEVARSVLPEGLVQSRLYVNGTLRSWMHYCQVRTAPGSQREHQIIAHQAWWEIQQDIEPMREIELKGED